jgi:hypothetical protein
MFTDLFSDVGRRSVPPMIVAVVIVLQRLRFDARWKSAAGST